MKGSKFYFVLSAQRGSMILILFAPSLFAPPRVAAGGASDWTFNSLTIGEAQATMASCSKTYRIPPPMFSCTPYIHPQGFVSFCYKEEVRLVLHFYEKKPEQFFITYICMRSEEMEAPRQLIHELKTSTRFQFDTLCFSRLPKWQFVAQFYSGDW